MAGARDAGKENTLIPEQQRLDAAFVHDIAERYRRAWNARDIDGFLALHTEDCIWEMPLTYPNGVARGHNAIRTECARAWAGLDEMHYATLDVFVSGDGARAAQYWTGHAKLTGGIVPPGYAPTNQALEMTGVSIWEFRAGRLARVVEHFDTIAVARQIGLVPQPGTVGERIGILWQRFMAWRMRRHAIRPARPVAPSQHSSH